jgi:hypothetical protein
MAAAGNRQLWLGEQLAKARQHLNRGRGQQDSCRCYHDGQLSLIKMGDSSRVNNRQWDGITAMNLGVLICNVAEQDITIAITVNAVERCATLQHVSAMGNAGIAITINTAEQCATL